MVSPDSPSTWPLAVRSPASHYIECVLCSLIEGPRAHRRVMSLPPSDTLSGLARALCRAGKGLALLATNQPGKQACIFKGWASPLWFTAPTETKLGTATVSAPGPLSSSQDELFAEDIQMYKEQIRLTQSSFALREKKERTGWLQKDLFPPASWMSERVREWKQPCVFKVLIHNLFL